MIKKALKPLGRKAFRVLKRQKTSFLICLLGKGDKNMAYYPKKPRLTPSNVIDSICQRTGLPKEAVRVVLLAYGDLAKEALKGQVEVPLADIGYLSWKQINARDNVSTWDNKNKCMSDPHPLDGFQKTVIRVNVKWAKELKEHTSFKFGEENPMLHLDDGEEEE